jgi:dual specificity protein kinase YAK1
MLPFLNGSSGTFIGLPLFPGASEYDVLLRMMTILGGQPPDYLLKEAKNTVRFFKHAGSYPGSEATTRLLAKGS